MRYEIIRRISIIQFFLAVFFFFLGCNASYLKLKLTIADPSHQRAGGNLRYFERMLSKELRDMGRSQQELTDERPIQLDTYERPKDYLPEREVYEALCRGEGVKLVSHNAP